MISTAEAKGIIQNTAQPKAAIWLPLQEAAGLTLAADTFAAMDIPAFPQSSMDGYAFSFAGWEEYKELVVEGEMPAGTTNRMFVSKMKAARIFTGAPVPPGADTVVMQEKTKTTNGKLIISDEQLQKGANVRPQGAEIKAGMLALPKGSWLSPAAVGFLAGIGISTVLVFPLPSVTLLVTGNELQAPGHPLAYGQVYESNSYSVKAVLQQLHITDVTIVQVPDALPVLTAALEKALQASDLVLLTGGVSVGDYDYVPQAALNCGVTPLFHKVKQRPGKPLYFGRRKQALVVGLPGNPSSVLTCLYLYVIPALKVISQQPFGLRTLQVPISISYQKASGLTHFLKATYNGESVTPLPAQESYRLHSFAQANCLLQIDEGTTVCEEGSLVTIHLLFA